MAALLLPVGLSAQKQSKTFKEEFKVQDDAVLELQTNHADIEFETWNKNEVVIEATVELEGASAEEAERFFEQNPVEIMGNSNRVMVRTKKGHGPGHLSHFPDMNDFNFEFKIAGPEDPLFSQLEIPELPPMPEMPPMPPIPAEAFDYEKFEKEGEKYMKKWQEEFRKGFNEEYEERLKEWAEAMKDRTEAWQERRQMDKDRMEKRVEMREHKRQEMQKAREAHREAMRKQQAEMREVVRSQHRNVVISKSGKEGEPTVYYYNIDGKEGNYKVKTTIRIKMPKSVTLDMNVRHGEVKLAEAVKDIRAQLSYASLHGNEINGKGTLVRVSYSPVHVRKWVQGELRTDFSGQVVLDEVEEMNLYANSSEVVIEQLNDKAIITGHLGSLEINELLPDFRKLAVELKNGKLYCSLPSTALSYALQGTSSSFDLPGDWEKSVSVDSKGKEYKNSMGTDPKLVISAVYSEVVLD